MTLSKFFRSLTIKHVNKSSPPIHCISNMQKRRYADHQIPDRLKDMDKNPKPKFFDMVEYFFHKAWVVIEDYLVEDLCKQKGLKLTLEQRKERVRGKSE